MDGPTDGRTEKPCALWAISPDGRQIHKPYRNQVPFNPRISKTVFVPQIHVDIAGVNDNGVRFLQSASIRRRFAIADFAIGDYERLRAETKPVVGAEEHRRPKQNDFAPFLILKMMEIAWCLRLILSVHEADVDFTEDVMLTTIELYKIV